MKLYKTILLALSVVMLAGCEDFLSHVPDDRTALKDVESVKALLVSAYPDGHYIMQGELMSDNADDKGSWRLSIYPEMQEEAYFWKVSTQSVQDAPEHYWGRLYKAIAASNHALEAIENNGSGADYAPYLGEAKMTRAFTHFLLVNFWAKHYNPATAATDLGIPYVKKPETEALVGYKRNTVKEVYEMIEKDIIDAFPLLQDNAYEVPKYHFTRAAANAFMARFYAFRGEAGDWDKVIDHTTAILGSGANFKAQLRDYVGKYMPVASNAQDYAALYTNYGDPAILLLTNAPSMWYYTSYYGRYGLSESRRNEVFRNALVRQNAWIGPYYGTWPHFTMMKFRDYMKLAYPGASSGIPHVLCPILTVEEALFNRAEAYVMKKNYEAAINDINVWLSTRTTNYVENTHRLGMREIEGKWVFDPEFALSEVVAYYTDNSSAIVLSPWYKDQLDNNQKCMLQYITDLRRKEFMQEGMRWFDIKRFGIEVTHRVFESSQRDVLTRDDPRRVWQIPAIAIAYGLEPNPR